MSSTTLVGSSQERSSRILSLLALLPGAFYLLLVLFIGLTFASPYFLTFGNLVNIALQASVVLIIALGMTLVILTEGVDLSLGPILGLAGVVAAMLLVSGMPFLVALPAALLAAMVLGTVNGFVISYLEMPPFVITLGVFGIAMSLAMALTGGDSIVGLPSEIRWFNEGVFLGLPVPIWATVALFLLTYVLLYHTRFGRYVFAIGGNRRALILSGVPVRAYHALVYVYAAGLTAVASFIMMARANAAHPTIGVGLEFDAIAAVILGGTSFSGGRGTLFGTVLGALAVATLRNGLNLIGIAAEWQAAAVGIVIILGVAADSLRGYNK